MSDNQTRKIRIIQHNCNRSDTAMHTCLHTAENTADIVIIQEPWIGHNTNDQTFYSISHPSFCLLISPTKHHPRTLTYVSNTNPHLKAALQPNICNDEDIQVVKINTPTIEPIYLFNIYNETPRYDRTLPYTIERILQQITLPERTILAGDFNAHHLWWNSKARRSIRHQTLIEILEEGDFDLINEEDTPTYHYTNGSSVLDLAFCTPTITPMISNWAVDEDNPTSSDHELIRFEISSDSDEQILPPTTERWNWKKADWDAFSKTLKETSDATEGIWTQLHAHGGETNLESSANYLTKIIQMAVSLHVPNKITTVRSKPWWNAEIDQKREIMHGRWREWKETRSTPARNQFNATRNSFFNSIREAKSKNWNNFLEGARGKDIFTAMRYTKPRRTDPTPDIILDNNTASTFKDKAKLFRKALFPPPPTAEIEAEDQTPMRRLPWPRVTHKEIRDAIMSSSSTKAPGPDGLGFECLKKAYAAIPEYFHALFEVLIRAGYHPKIWREATIAIIKKSGKPDYSAPKAYRPISLLNCLGKISEKIMATRLAHMAERYNLLHRLQIGGRPKRSAVDAAMFLTTRIDEANKKGKTTSTLCIDVKGAFDNVYKDRLIQTMRKMKLDQKTIRWVESFLSNRMASLSFDKDKEQMTRIDTGIPQGSPVSPILFLIYLSPLFEIMDSQHPDVTCPSYIDDICLMVEGDSPEMNAATLEGAVATCFNWGRQNAVAFDDPKSELMHFYTARKEIKNPYVNVVLPNGTLIEPSDVQRWLGFWLDRKLTWKFHIQTRTTSAMRVFMALSRLGNTEKGLTQAALRQLYQSCITTVADFGAEVWWNQQKTQSLPFQRLQNQAMRKIAGAFKTTPIAALEAELGLPPADLRLDRMQRGYATRLLTLPESHPVLTLCPDTFPKTLDNERENGIPPTYTPWHKQNPLKPRYESRLTRILSQLNNIIQPPSIIEQIDVTAAAPWDNTSAINIHISQEPKEVAAQKHNTKHHATHLDAKHICFYTDGSLLEGKSGTGVHASRAGQTVHESKYYLGTETEVFDAELYGIMKAAEVAVKISKDEPTTDVWIFCDNQAAVRRMEDKRPIPGQEYILKTHSNAETLAQHNIRTHIHWVPGHVNVKGNERADILAKAGTEEKRIPRDATTSITYLKRKNKEQQMLAWNARWPTMKRGRSYQGRPAPNIHTVLRNHRSRRLVATIIQMRTGHGYNRQYLSRIPSSKIDSPTCTCGYRKQTPQHLLLECRYYKTQRKRLRKDIKPYPLTWQTVMHTGKGLQAVVKFLEETGIGTRTWILGPKNDEVNGFGWSHMRDDGDDGEEGEERERAGEHEEAEVVGVG